MDHGGEGALLAPDRPARLETPGDSLPETIDLKELGPWIDGQDEEARLRIREATGWGYSNYPRPPVGQRYSLAARRLCIADHAGGFTASWIYTYSDGPAEWFDELCETYGLEPVVAACKARAS